MDKIVLFDGSKKDFNAYVEKHSVEEYTPFMELIRQYNEKIRANDTSAVNEVGEVNKNIIENVVMTYTWNYSKIIKHLNNYSQGLN